MSITAVSSAFKAPVEINGAARWTLLILCEYADDEGYSYPKVSTIARRAAIRREETVREALRSLEADGYIERIINGWAGVRGQIPEGRRPNLYRIHIDAEGLPAGPKTARKAGRGATQKSGTRPTQKTGSGGSPKNGYQNHHCEPPGEPHSPTPLNEAEPVKANGSPPSPPPTEEGRLPLGGPPTRKEQDQAHASANRMLDAAFGEWWSDYPSGQGRGQKAAALRAWRKRVGNGKDRNGAPISSGDLRRRLENYRRARALYADYWAQRGEDERPPLLNGSTFINSRSADWEEPWTETDIRFWPAPRGREWGEAPGSGYSSAGLQDALEAEIAAERQGANHGK